MIILEQCIDADSDFDRHGPLSKPIRDQEPREKADRNPARGEYIGGSSRGISARVSVMASAPSELALFTAIAGVNGGGSDTGDSGSNGVAVLSVRGVYGGAGGSTTSAVPSSLLWSRSRCLVLARANCASSVAVRIAKIPDIGRARDEVMSVGPGRRAVTLLLKLVEIAAAAGVACVNSRTGRPGGRCASGSNNHAERDTPGGRIRLRYERVYCEGMALLILKY